jgi:hypothetical protein
MALKPASVHEFDVDAAEDAIAGLRGQAAALPNPQYLVPGVQPAFFPNSTVATSFLSSLAVANIPAGDPDINSVYEIETWGNGVQGSTAQTLEFSVSAGGTAMTNITFGTQAFGTTPANAIFRFLVIGRVIFQAIGTSGVMTSYLKANVTVFGATITPNTNNFAEGFSCESITTYTINTLVNNNYSVSAAWGSTTGGPTLTSQVAIPKRIV